VLLYNNSNTPFQENKGDRIAQIVFYSLNIPKFHVTNQHDSTSRGEGGFGSTGISNPTAHEATIKQNNIKQYNEILTPDLIEEERENYTEIEIKTLQDVDISSEKFKLPHSRHTSDTTSTTILVRPVDRVPSASRKLVRVSPHQLYQSFAYRNIDNVLKHLSTITDKNISIKRDPDDIIKNTGEFATIHKSRSNKKFNQPIKPFGKTIHINIGYGSDDAIGGIKYCLFIID